MEIFTHVLPKLGGFLVREWVWAVVMLSHVLPPRGVSLTSTTDHKERDWTKWWCEITLKAERTYMFTWNEMKGSDEVWFYWSQYSKHVHCVTSKFSFHIDSSHHISLYLTPTHWLLVWWLGRCNKFCILYLQKAFPLCTCWNVKLIMFPQLFFSWEPLADPQWCLVLLPL